MTQTPPPKPGIIERLGAKYLVYKARKARLNRIETPIDEPALIGKVRLVTSVAVLGSFLAGGLSAFVTVYVDVAYTDDPPLTYWSVIIPTIAFASLIELLIIYWISLEAVHAVTVAAGVDLTRFDDYNVAIGEQTDRMLARAALEIPDPVRQYLGIDPLAHVPKRLLFWVGLLYKAKVMLSNAAFKYGLRFLIGRSVVRISVDYISVPITGFWNGFVLWKVMREARLRLFGAILSNQIVDQCLTPEVIERLSPLAKVGLIRAVANAVVLTQNYHPNMLLLLVKLSAEFDLQQLEALDQWEVFIDCLAKVNEQERFFILDLLAVAAAFDGRISKLESTRLAEAFGSEQAVYYGRIIELRRALLSGNLNQARQYIRLDFQAG